MPELPEVETIANALRPALVGRTITSVEVFSPKMREPITPLLTAHLEGQKIVGVRRRGRYFIIDLEDRRALLGHLGMSGVVRIEPLSVAKRKHEHIFIHLDDDNIFRFECTRRFSMLKVVQPLPNGDIEELASLGVEPLTAEFNGSTLWEASRKRRISTKVFIMDNAVVVGVGNIYATEVLFATKISPLRPANELSRSECDMLAEEIKKVLRHAIELGGSTIHDFKHVDGSEGKFALELKVYGKSGQLCPVWGNVLEHKQLGGRTSCFCAKCQK